MDKKILLYGFEGNRFEGIKNLAAEYDFEIISAGESDLKKRVGEIFALDYVSEEDKVYKDEDVETEFILFSDFDRTILRNFITDLRSREMVVNHKSVVTKHTVNWELGYLIAHIMDEHQVVSAVEELNGLMRKAKEYLNEEDNEEIQEAVNYALSLNQKSDVKLEDINDRIKRFEELL
ncbi:MAG: DUF3783 domain-containing protein [Peptoniphilus sp.]|nr:DUF3783 domain-containing protein [Peptoniphilus sp.]